MSGHHTPESNLAILELEKPIVFNEYNYAAFLPRQAVNYYGTRTTVGIPHTKHGYGIIKKIKALVWTNDICHLFNYGKKDNFMCIDIEDDYPGYNLCEVQFIDIKYFV